VAECVGVHVVGYTVMVYGIGGTMGSFISGKLLALKTEFLPVLGTLFIHLIVMVFLVIWEREPILLILLFISLVWGACDGSWITLCNSKCEVVSSQCCVYELKLRCVFTAVWSMLSENHSVYSVWLSEVIKCIYGSLDNRNVKFSKVL